MSLFFGMKGGKRDDSGLFAHADLQIPVNQSVRLASSHRVDHTSQDLATSRTPHVPLPSCTRLINILRASTRPKTSMQYTASADASSITSVKHC